MPYQKQPQRIGLYQETCRKTGFSGSDSQRNVLLLYRAAYKGVETVHYQAVKSGGLVMNGKFLGLYKYILVLYR